jgi:hypothetical protein
MAAHEDVFMSFGKTANLGNYKVSFQIALLLDASLIRSRRKCAHRLATELSDGHP